MKAVTVVFHLESDVLFVLPANANRNASGSGCLLNGLNAVVEEIIERLADLHAVGRNDCGSGFDGFLQPDAEGGQTIGHQLFDLGQHRIDDDPSRVHRLMAQGIACRAYNPACPVAFAADLADRDSCSHRRLIRELAVKHGGEGLYGG
ncbi:MAG: hypothetical protein APF80_14005 [Alphaproteobacteria bacterium BRH_c36]|nr:MAG: hypothetical protein APF80_14005 [Alphaproteobacteria bacterium BRH_c36]